MPPRRYAAAATAAAAARCAVSRSGHLRTAECKDLTGIPYRLLALQWPVVFDWSAGRVPIRIPGWDVEVVEYPSFLDQIRIKSHLGRQFFQESCHHVAPRFLAEVEVQSLARFLRCLLRGETCPIVALSLAGFFGVGEIVLGLLQPVPGSVAHPVLCCLPNEPRNGRSVKDRMYCRADPVPSVPHTVRPTVPSSRKHHTTSLPSHHRGRSPSVRFPRGPKSFMPAHRHS